MIENYREGFKRGLEDGIEMGTNDTEFKVICHLVCFGFNEAIESLIKIDIKFQSALERVKEIQKSIKMEN